MAKRRGITLDDLPPAYREIAEKQLREGAREGTGAGPSCPNLPGLPPSGGSDTPKGRKRGKKLRQMNATEREFFAYLKREYPEREIEYEKHTLRWGEGASMLAYTPDFIVRSDYLREEDRKVYIRLICFEVKGARAWKQDIVKFKAAVTHFSYLEFQFWEKDEEGRWHHTI